MSELTVLEFSQLLKTPVQLRTVSGAYSDCCFHLYLIAIDVARILSGVHFYLAKKVDDLF